MNKLESALIKIDEIPPEGLAWSLTLSPEDFPFLFETEGEAPPKLLAPLKWELTLKRSGRRLLIKGALAGLAEASCDRCLGDYAQKLEAGIDEAVELREPGAPPPEDEGALDVIDGRVSLRPLLAELFWLVWPCRLLCAPGCPGLCPQCGDELKEGPCSCERKNAH